MISSSVIITKFKDKYISALIKDNHITQLSVSDSTSLVGNIYIGKVKHILKNVNACFVEFKKDTLGFLSFNDIYGNDSKIVEGLEIPVQVVKDASKGKEAVLSMKLSLRGYYSIVEYSDPCLNISRKINGEEKSSIRDICKDISKFSVIVRTNTKSLQNKSPLINEISELSDKLEYILNTSRTRTCYSLVYEAQTDYENFIENLPALSYERILTDQSEVLHRISEAEYYEDSYPLIKLYSLESKLDELLSKTVWLKSGGNIVIEYTEAMTVIDVNTAKNLTKKDKETTSLQVNLEAGKEIARQIRLRNLSGIIIIDFINMTNKENNETLISNFKEYLKEDLVRCDFVDITSLGLVEVVRKKIKAPIFELLQK